MLVAFSLSLLRVGVIPAIGISLEFTNEDFNLLTYSVFAAGYKIIPFHFLPGFIKNVLYEFNQRLSWHFFAMMMMSLLFLKVIVDNYWPAKEVICGLLAAYTFLALNFFVGIYQSRQVSSVFVIRAIGIISGTLFSMFLIALNQYYLSTIVISINFSIVFFSQRKLPVYFDYKKIILLAITSFFTFLVQNFDKILYARSFNEAHDLYAYVAYGCAVASVLISTNLLDKGPLSFQQIPMFVHIRYAASIFLTFIVGFFVLGDRFLLLTPLFLILIERLNVPVIHRLLQAGFAHFLSQAMISLVFVGMVHESFLANFRGLAFIILISVRLIVPVTTLKIYEWSTR